VTGVLDAQLSLHQPSAFIAAHWQALLPDWTTPVQSVLLYLQRSPVTLCDRSRATAAAKHHCRRHFLNQAKLWRQIVTAQGYLGEAFDPQTGWPVHSTAGSMVLDDVALVQTLLGYCVDCQGDCRVVHHPTWQTAVYPSTFLCSAPLRLMETWLASVPSAESPW
jgi:hypothetical protein